LLAALLLAANPVLAAIAPGSASAAVDASNARLHKALEVYFKATGAAKERARNEARNAVGALLDFDALAQATMGKHWSELTSAQKKHYSEALRGAMEANYLSKMKQGQVDINKVHNELQGEEKQGEKTLVKTRVTTESDNAQVDYVMEKGKKGWRAVDVVTEGVSLVDTYKDQVIRLLPRKGVDGVIQSLEKAKKRIEEEEPAKAGAAEK
jgi:phospholipid transport system substrate-binding protein